MSDIVLLSRLSVEGDDSSQRRSGIGRCNHAYSTAIPEEESRSSRRLDECRSYAKITNITSAVIFTIIYTSAPRLPLKVVHF